jgi:hypothetical protein
MEPWFSLAETVLWVGLIACIVWRFHKPIHGLLVAIQQRIEEGSAVKAGPFEISEILNTVAPGDQKQKLASELVEEPQDQELPPPPALEQTLKAVPSLSFQAEDLGLRAIQAEYGRPIIRQISSGGDYSFDGAFNIGGELHILEVKYIRSLSSIPRLRGSLEKLAGAISQRKWSSVRVILVAVFERDRDIPEADRQLLDVVKGLGIPFIVRPFSMEQLQLQFGLIG